MTIYCCSKNANSVLLQNKTVSSAVYALLVFVLSMFLLACGGGSGGSPASEMPQGGGHKKEVSGRATLTNSPVVGANAVLYDLSTGQKLALAKTDSDGRYSFEFDKSAKNFKVVVTNGSYQAQAFTGTLMTLCDDLDRNKCNADLYTTAAAKNTTNISQFRAAKKDVLNTLGVSVGKDPSINQNALDEYVAAKAKNLDGLVLTIAEDTSDGFVDSTMLRSMFAQARIRPDDPRPNDPNLSSPLADRLMNEAVATLNDPSIPNTTKSEFEKTVWANKNAEELSAERQLKRQQRLALHAEDPDPKWKTTGADNDLVIGKPGKTYMVEFFKRNYAGERIANITQKDLEMLRLEVRLQVAENDYQYIASEYHHNYVKWIGSADQKKLQITLPNTLRKGRLIVGVRPSFTNEGQRVLTERWSKAITVEVWPTKPNVNTLDAENEVVFPLVDDKFASNSAFTLDEIRVATERFIEKSSEPIALPVVVKGVKYKVGDLIDYVVEQRPHSGEVAKITSKDNQQLLLLVPKLVDVYDIMGGEEGFLKKQGVSPENIIFREGGQLPAETNPEPESPKYLGPKDKIQIQGFLPPANGDEKLFKTECNAALENSKNSFAFTPDGEILSANPWLSVKATLGFTGIRGKGECKIGTNSKRFSFDATNLNPVTRVLNKVIGLSLSAGPYGEIKVSVTVTGGSLGAYATAGYKYSLNGGGQPTKSFKFENSAQGDGLKGTTGMGELALAGELGLKAELTAISFKQEDSWIGWCMKKLGIKLEFDIKAEAKAAGVLKGALNSYNAAYVYQKGKNSGATVDFNAKFELNLTATLKKLVKYFGLKVSPGIRLQTPKINLFKADARYILGELNDDGQGRADVEVTIPADSLMLRELFGYVGTGLASIKDESSSVFNDKNKSITYEMSECKQRGGKIETPFVGCTAGLFFCAKVDDTAKLCGGQVKVTPVAGSGVEGDPVSTSGTVKVTGTPKPNEKPLNVSVSGGPLSPSPTSFQLKSGESESFNAKTTCPSRGVYRGSITASAGADNKDEQTNVLSCRCKRGTKDCDRNWGDPYFVTADGLAYEYIASGDYVMQRIVDKNNKPIEGLEVQARFLPGHEVSWTHAAAIRVGNDVVEFFPERGSRGTYFIGVKLNGNNLPFSRASAQSRVSKLPSGGMIYYNYTNQGRPGRITVLWPQHSVFEKFGVQLTVPRAVWQNPQPFMDIQFIRPDDFKGQERGLMGNNDGNPNNEFIRRNGQVLGGSGAKLSWTELYGLFGGDWLVKGGECLFSDGCMQQPDFPATAKILTPEQRRFGELACQGLVGFYKEACIHDVGLTGSPQLVKEFYANANDLNDMADKIVTPGVDYAWYKMSRKPKVWSDEAKYTQKTVVEHVKGKGKYVLTIRPPKQATAKLIDPATGKLVSNLTSSLDAGKSQAYDIKVDCKTADPQWKDLSFSSLGSVQLWSIDPLSGFAGQLIDERVISCAKPNDGSNIQIVNNKNVLLDDASRLWWWGSSTKFTQLFDMGSMQARITNFAHSGNYYLALDEFGEVWSWGRGSLGLGNATYKATPNKITSLSGQTITELAAGRDHSIALADDGSVWTWGSNYYGQLGNDAVSSSNTPMQLVNAFDGELIKDIAAGDNHSLALTQSGKLYAWGQNYLSQLGTLAGAGANNKVPSMLDMTVFGGVKIESIYVKHNQNFAIDAKGRLWAWGANQNGRLGIDSTKNTESKPTLVAGIVGRVIDVAIGSSHGLALTNSSVLYGWGSNSYGELGRDDTASQIKPVEVTNAQNLDIVTIAAGENYSLARTSTDELYAWGQNNAGQLGIEGSQTSYATPNMVKLKGALTKSNVHVARSLRMRVGESLTPVADYSGVYPVLDDNLAKAAITLPTSEAVSVDTVVKQGVTTLTSGIRCNQLGSKVVDYVVSDIDGNMLRTDSLALSCLPPAGLVSAEVTADEQTMLGGEVRSLGKLNLDIQPKLGEAKGKLTLIGSGLGLDWSMSKVLNLAVGNKEIQLYAQCDIAGVSSQPYKLTDDTGKVVYSGVAKVKCLPAAAVTSSTLKGKVVSTQGQQVSMGSLKLQVNATYNSRSVTFLLDGEDIGFVQDANKPIVTTMSKSTGEQTLELFAACSAVGTTSRNFKLLDGAKNTIHEGSVTVDCRAAAKQVGNDNYSKYVAAIDATGMSNDSRDYGYYNVPDNFVSVGFTEFDVSPAVGKTKQKITIEGKGLGFLVRVRNWRRDTSEYKLFKTQPIYKGRRRIEVYAECNSVAKEVRNLAIKDEFGNVIYTGKVTVNCLANIDRGWVVSGDGDVQVKLSNLSKKNSGALNFVASMPRNPDEPKIALGEFGDAWKGAVKTADSQNLAINGVACPVDYGQRVRIGDLLWFDDKTKPAVFRRPVWLDRTACETQGYFFDPVNLTALQGAKLKQFKAIGKPQQREWCNNPETLNTGLDNKGRLWQWRFSSTGGGWVDEEMPRAVVISRSEDTEPVAVDLTNLAGTSIAGFDVSPTHTMIVDVKGRVWAYGNNYNGILGIPLPKDAKGNTVKRHYPSKPLQVVLPAQVGAVVAVSAGTAHSLALDKSGRVWAWGGNRYGELGNALINNAVQAPSLVDLSNLNGAKVVEISAGNGLSIIKDSVGRLWYWGTPIDESLHIYGRPADTDANFKIRPLEIGRQNGHPIEFDAKYKPHVIDSYGRVWHWQRQLNPLGRGSSLVFAHDIDATPTGRSAKLANKGFNMLAFDSDNRLWLKSVVFFERSRINKLPRKKVHLNMLNGANITYLHDDDITSLIFDSRGNLWRRNNPVSRYGCEEPR